MKTIKLRYSMPSLLVLMIAGKYDTVGIATLIATILNLGICAHDIIHFCKQDLPTVKKLWRKLRK